MYHQRMESVLNEANTNIIILDLVSILGFQGKAYRLFFGSSSLGSGDEF